jgi:competence protein ComEC
VGAAVRIWLALVGLSAGTLGAHARPGARVGAAVVAVGCPLLLRRRSCARLAGLGAVAFGLGWLATSVRATATAPVEALAERVPHCTVEATVIESAGGLGTLASVRRARCEGLTPVEGAGVVVLDGAPAGAGASLVAEGWLVPLGDDGFGSARRALGARAELDVHDLVIRPPRGPVFRVAHWIRRGLDRASGGIDARRAALLRGLAVGDTEEMDPSLTESFRRSGLSHLVAVSGSNVAIVLGAVSWLLRSLALRTRVAVAGAALVLFVVVVGPEPSVLRAALMGAIGLAAVASGRRASPMNALGLTLLLLIGARPGMVDSVGLHLSAAATAGIVAWARPVGDRLRGVPRPVALALGVTLAAQLAVAPLLARSFGRISLASPAANVAAAAAVPPATVLGLAAALAGAVHAPTGRLVARLAEPFVAWIMVVGEWFGSQSWASIVVVPQLWIGLALVVGAAALVTAARAVRR